MFQRLKEKFNWPVWIVGLLSTGLIIYQFLFRKGLWLDELSIAHNLTQRNFLELLKPLDKDQIAPIMFLWVEKFLLMCSNVINENLSDHFLRLYPLLCGLGVVLLYYKLILKLTGSYSLSLLAYILLVLNPIFIYYTSEVKQYICELFYAILLIYTWTKNSEDTWNTKKTLLFSLVILLCVFNSSTICFVNFPMALYDGWKILMQDCWQIKKLAKDRQVFFYITRYLLSLLFLISYYFFFLYLHPSADFMANFWENSFITFKNILQQLDRACTWLYTKQVNTFICIVGLTILLKLKDKRIFVLSFFTFLIHIIFSYFKLYPVSGRLVFYWLAILPVCLAAILSYVYSSFFNNLYGKLSILLLLTLCTIFYFRHNHFPIYLYDRYPKAPFSYIEKHYTTGDIIIPQRLSFSSNGYLLQYYTNSITEDSFFSIPDKKWGVFLTKSLEYIASLKTFERVWLLFNTGDRSDVQRRLVNNKLFKALPIELSSCKTFNKIHTLCLIQYKKRNQ